jgi:hypothetical protein
MVASGPLARGGNAAHQVPGFLLSNN